MYRDSFTEPGWARVLRRLAASFPVGRCFGVRVRVYWLAVIILPLLLLRNVEGWPFAQGATYVFLTTAALFTVIWTHELGHIMAGRRYGIDTPLITLSPMGGVAHMASGAPSPQAEVRIALAGPAVHVLWLAIAWPLSLLLSYGAFAPNGWFYDPLVDVVETLVWLNVALLAFNLLPLFPMDGGRVLRGVLAGRMHPNRATLQATRVGLIGGWAFIVIGVAAWILRDDLSGTILVAIGISNLMACRQERMVAEHSAGPYMTTTPRRPWESDPEGWRRGAAQGDESPRREGRRARREARRWERRAEAERALRAEVDRILDRVSQVGLDGLSAKERRILENASKRRRGD